MAAYTTTPPAVPASSAAAAPPPADERRAVERKLSRARARLFARIDELGRRVAKAKNAVDVAQVIRDHPFTAVGIALSAGVLVGLPRRHTAGGKVRGQLSALITAIAINAVRSSVSGWVLDQLRGTPSPSHAGTAPAS